MFAILVVRYTAVTRYEFSSLFAEAWYAAMTANNIQTGFKISGVFPFNKYPFDLPTEKYRSFNPEEVVKESKLKYIHCTVLYHVAEGIYQMIVTSQMKQQSRKPVGEDPILPTGYIQVFDSVYDDITSDTANQICSIVWSQKRVL